MKKRLLITSIVMMLVVAVALSTATYAWFTSNVSVSATSVTMTAGTSQSTALGIEWSAGTPGTTAFNAHYTTSINSVAPALTTEQAGGFQPAAPVLLDTISTHAAPVFKTAFVDAQGYFKTAGDPTDVYRFANYANATAAEEESDELSTLIHVANLAQSGDQTVYLTASISGDAADMIRIAVYEVTVDDSGAEPVDVYTYKGLLAATAGTDNTAEGAITGTVETVPQAASSLVTADATTELNLGVHAAQTDKAYAIYVWLDGALFDEARSTDSAEVGLTFSTTKASAGTVTEINPAA